MGILVCERPLVASLDILTRKRTLLAILGRIVHEHFWVSDLGILVVNFGRLARDYPLVPNLSKVVCEHLLVANLGRLAKKRTLVADMGKMVREHPQVVDLGRLAS